MGDRIGPKLTVHASCHGCKYERSESYAVQGDSGRDVYCAHGGQRRGIGDTRWDTPVWCPERQPDPRDARIAELEAALAGLAVAAVDAASFDVCHEDQCPRLSTWWRVAVGNAAWESCDEHIESFRAEDAKAESKGCRKREGWREREEADEVRAFGAAIEAAERALGRRK